MNRVVVTGYGVASAIGNTAEEFWNSLYHGKIGISPITKFDASSMRVYLAAEIKDFSFGKYFKRKNLIRMDLFSIYGIYAALEAMTMAQLDASALDVHRFGVIMGSAFGGLATMQEEIVKMYGNKMELLAPFFAPKVIPNMAAGNVSLRLGAKGICISISTACASGTHAIGEAFRNIKYGHSDVIAVGGTEAAICETGIFMHASLMALTNATNPMRALLPFDKNRDGFVMGEGAGVLILESLDYAKKRKAKILGEVVGYGATSDAYHMTSPLPDGDGAVKAIKLALEEAGIEPSQIGYINAHGTGTKANDREENKAIERVFGLKKSPWISSTKSLTGHLLGASGAVESIVLLQALKHQFIPATAGTQELDEEIHSNVLIGKGIESKFDYAMSNSLGFGGHNGVVILKKW